MLTTVNNAAINTEVPVSFQISVFGCLVVVVVFFFYIYPGVEMLGHMAVLFLFSF